MASAFSYSLEHFSAHLEDQHPVERVEPRHLLKALAQQRNELFELDVEVGFELGALLCGREGGEPKEIIIK